MAIWRVARSLIDLLHEVDAAAPNRAKGRDGTIGDTAHQARASRHNPNAAGVVTARDVTNDPAGGMPIHAIVRDLTAHPDEVPVDLDYIISNRQLASRDEGPWTWRPYAIPAGGDPHEEHAHFGVGRGPDGNPVGPYDDPSDWHIASCLARINHHQEDDMAASPTIFIGSWDGKEYLVDLDKRRADHIVSGGSLASLKTLYPEVGALDANTMKGLVTIEPG